MVSLSNLLSLFPLFVHFVITKSAYIKLPEINEDFTNDSHLKYEHIKLACLNRDKICKSEDINVCAVRLVDNREQYKDFENSCYLFFYNMCEHPGKEFSIVASGNCELYINSRRHSAVNGSVTNDTNKITRNKTEGVPAKSKTILRDKTTMSTLYEIDSAFDNHICPLSCPDVYEPVCVNVNRQSGKYFKFYTFVNHCAGDMYYCKHWEEFSPPPDTQENVVSSKLGWSFCGSSRYLQFARFSEVTSSLGHYGWLAGNYKYTHIMEPHERIKGYG